MTKNNIKAVLFASLIVAMVLPFSAMNLAEAATHENANDIAKKVKDSLSITNAERDVKLNAGYELYPYMGWVSPDRIKATVAYVENPNKAGEMILDLNAMETEYNELKKAKITRTSGDPLQDFWNSLYQLADAAQTSYDAAIKDDSDNDITYHRAYWNVPDSPETYNGGTNFNFNAVQPDLSTNLIFQPMLQHGYSSYCDAGDGWVTYPFIYAFGNAYGGSCIDADEGDLIRGILSEGANNVWTISIKNYQDSSATDSYSVTYNGDMESVFTAVETWNIPTNCTEYQGDVEFKSQLTTGAVDSWTAGSVYTTFCGMDINIVSDSKVQFNNDN